MPATFRHFAINANEVPRAKAFYEGVFGWKFDQAAPGFYQIGNAGEGLRGALQERRDLAPARPVLGVEATFGVDDIHATLAAVEAAGGKIIMQPYHLPGVGHLIYFEDTEGNFIGAMQYEPGIFD